MIKYQVQSVYIDSRFNQFNRSIRFKIIGYNLDHIFYFLSSIGLDQILDKKKKQFNRVFTNLASSDSWLNGGSKSFAQNLILVQIGTLISSRLQQHWLELWMYTTEYVMEAAKPSQNGLL